VRGHLPANCLIPRQLVGCNCFIRNVQHASRTEFIWSNEDAGKSTCGEKTPSYNVTYPYIDIIKIVEIAEKLFSIRKFATAVVSLDVQ